MKKYFLLLLFSFSFLKFSSAQILCIYCYDQNSPVSTGINNLVLNGGFENTTCIPITGIFCPNSTNYSCDILNWTCTGGGSQTYANILDTSSLSLSIIVEGIKAPYFGNAISYCCSSSIDTFCLNNINCTVTGIPSGFPTTLPNFGGTNGISLEQTISGLTLGNTYVLEFWAGGEAYLGSGFFDSGLFAIDVGFGDTLLRDKPTYPAILGLADTIGTRYIIEFNATSSSHTIKFTNWGHICNTCTELVLDDVRLYTLSELDASVPHCTLGMDFPSASGGLENLVSPNPFTNELNVKTNSNELSEIIFYDIASRKLLQQTFINSASMNTEELSKGIYFYEIKNKNSVVKKGKVVKE